MNNEDLDQPAESTGEMDLLWTRLRANIERLATLGQQRLAPDALARRLARRAERLRHRMLTEPAESPLVFLGFHQGRSRYGIPIEAVLEVGPLEHFTRIPNTPPFICGVVQWRGAILTLLDLGELFGISESGIADLHVCVIVEAAGKRVALVAGQVEDIFSVPPQQVKTAPELSRIPPEWLLGVQDENRMVLRMDVILQDEQLTNWRVVLGGQ